MNLTAFDVNKNEKINEALKSLYDEYTPAFLSAWFKAFKEDPPFRINEFGIIDVNRYNSDNGILFIGRETNGWKDEAYQDGWTFLTWMYDITQERSHNWGDVSPTMWYNIGRWATLIGSPETPIDVIANLKEEAINAISTIAFTNINKVRGKNKSGKEYYELANAEVVKTLIQKEVEIINPKIIVTCGTWYPVASFLPNYNGKIISMNHPAARKSSKVMLEELQKQI